MEIKATGATRHTGKVHTLLTERAGIGIKGRSDGYVVLSFRNDRGAELSGMFDFVVTLSKQEVDEMYRESLSGPLRSKLE